MVCPVMVYWLVLQPKRHLQLEVLLSDGGAATEKRPDQGSDETLGGPRAVQEGVQSCCLPRPIVGNAAEHWHTRQHAGEASW